tara:strand:+ start:5917 stop:6582 length:666 start_codon:yes stop_codon:yes gene_type:complete
VGVLSRWQAGVLSTIHYHSEEEQMANMQWSQLRPIHDAAAALDGLADDATADELADAVSQAMEHLAKALDVLEISDRVAARLIPKWKSTNGSLRNAISDRSSEISRRLLDANDGKSLPVVVESDNGEQVVCTPKVSIRRSEIKRQELLEAVDRAVADPKNRLNPDGSGELLDFDAAKLLLHKKVFRPEPRWSELKKIGISDDEFCRRESSYTLDVQQGVTL